MKKEFSRVMVVNANLIEPCDIEKLKKNEISDSLMIYDLTINSNYDFIIYPSDSFEEDENIPEWLACILIMMKEYHCEILRIKYNGQELSFSDSNGMIHRQAPDIQMMMSISTGNVSEKTRQYLDRIVQIGKSELVRPKAGYGWFITKQSANDDNFNNKTSPHDIMYCMHESELNQCEILCLDADVPM